MLKKNKKIKTKELAAEELASSPKMRGRRLKMVRSMTVMSRSEFEERYGISAGTIQSWEAGKAGGISERGVVRILSAFQKENIRCTQEWLLYGIGASPQIIEKVTPSVETITPISQDESVIQELMVFRQLNPNAIDMVVVDDGMTPQYQPGDYIGGICLESDAIIQAVGLDCIVQTTRCDKLFRQIKKGSTPGLYNLICTNTKSTLFETVIYDQILLNVAPVVWHRRLKYEENPP